MSVVQPEEELWLFHSVYTMICIVGFQTLYRNMYLFPNHVQSCEFNSSELQSIYRNLKDEQCEKFPTALQISAALFYIAG